MFMNQICPYCRDNLWVRLNGDYDCMNCKTRKVGGFKIKEYIKGEEKWEWRGIPNGCLLVMGEL